MSGRATEQKKERTPGPLDRFHLRNEDTGKITGVYDYEILTEIMKKDALFVIGKVPFIYDGGYYKQDTSGAILTSMIQQYIYPQYIKSSTLKRIYDLFIKKVELLSEFDDMNTYPDHWVPFQNGFYDPISQNMIKHDPRFRATNQIPMNFFPDEKPPGDHIEEWLHFAVEKDDNREMLLQYFGYCHTPDTRQQKFLVFVGEGGTGKSTMIRLLEKILGMRNLSSISLVELTQRFAAYGLMGKMVNSCADLEVTALEDTTRLKKLLGEDTTTAEAKGKDGVSFHNYAKMVFSTNELPIVKNERTNGFYRRLLVLPMNRVPPVQRADLFENLEKELPYFVHLCMDALTRMYQNGRIAESADSKEAIGRLRMDSDTVEAFLVEDEHKAPGERAERGQLFSAYQRYCTETERQALNRNNFYRALRSKGFTESKDNDGNRLFNGISLTKNCREPAVKPAVNAGFVEVDEPLPF